jgi:lysylphosphatidylglycerol synthetase-like protein (DUF2156 family)
LSNFFKNYKRIASILGILVIVYLIYNVALNPIIQFIDPQKRNLPEFSSNILSNLPSFLQTIIIALVVVLLLALVLVFVIGYVAFTGWKYRQGIPWTFRLLIAFVLGVLALLIAIPIAILVTPFVAIVIAVVVLWFVLRNVSKKVGPIYHAITVEQAVEAAKKEHESNFGSVNEIREAQLKDKAWIVKISYFEGPKDSLVEYRVDASTGAVKEWRKL